MLKNQTDIYIYTKTFYEHLEIMFSHLCGGDMMMIAKWNGKEWIT